jgi:hypothetical protein
MLRAGLTGGSGERLGQARRTVKTTIFWDRYFAALREPKVRGRVPHADPEIHRRITADLARCGLSVRGFRVDVADYRAYLRRASYEVFGYYAGGRAPNFAEKSLEHYLAARFLDLTAADVYIDVANGRAPTPEIYHALYGCEAYRQDLLFEAGVHGRTIGGDAGSMPVPDGFATKMALHCSFEHFEQDADIRFIEEAGRVLRAGGRLCIVPLYLFTEYAIQTDPVELPRGGLPFERNAVLFGVKGWRNRHARFYSVPELMDRLIPRLGELRLAVYAVENAADVDPGCYVKFVALLEKRGPLGGRKLGRRADGTSEAARYDPD